MSARSRLPAARAGRWLIGWRGVLIASAAAALGIGHYFYNHEGEWPNQLFVASGTALFAATLVLMTRRLLVAAVLVPATIAIIVSASLAKHKAVEMSVHAYDVVFYLMSGPTLYFLWSEYRGLLVMLVGALLAAAILAALAYRL